MDMMVKVWNRNKFDHKELWRDKQIHIPAGGHISMDYDEANRFMGQMFSPKFDKGGIQLPESYKWLEVDKDDRRRVEMSLRNETEEKAKRVFVCMACNKEFESKKALMAHSKEKHSDILVKEEGEDGKD
jgi:hypothetical protein